jgi:hypothetical protein
MRPASVLGGRILAPYSPHERSETAAKVEDTASEHCPKGLEHKCSGAGINVCMCFSLKADGNADEKGDIRGEQLQPVYQQPLLTSKIETAFSNRQIDDGSGSFDYPASRAGIKFARF